MTSAHPLATGGAPRLKWAIEVQSTQLERRNLADLLRRLGFELMDEAPHVAFSSPGINECTIAAEAYEIAKSVREAFIGPAGIDTEFTLGRVIDYTTLPARRHAFLELQSGAYVTSFMEVTLVVGPPSGLSEEQIREWREQREEAEYQAKLDAQLSKLEPAFFSPRAAKVLDLLSIRSPTGETLFKAYEVMRGARSNMGAFASRFSVSDTDYRRFSDAVHKDSVSGDWARHAHGEPPQTQNPMSKAEAEAFVRRLASMWLQDFRDTRSV